MTTTTPADLSRPLDDREIGELDTLLEAVPEAQNALDIAALDGYLAGVLLQPEEVPAAAWLPLVFAADGDAAAIPAADPSVQRATALILRRHAELAACLAAREPFDPIIFEIEDDAGAALAGKASIVALEPWAAGFATALEAFPGLTRAVEADQELAVLVAGVLRHLPPPPDANSIDMEAYAREQADFDREVPLADLDDALDDMIACALAIAETVRPHRPVQRAGPKVGRNDACPCGSGRKYKVCHGRDG